MIVAGIYVKFCLINLAWGIPVKGSSGL